MQSYQHHFDRVARQRRGHVDRIAALLAVLLSAFASIVCSGFWHVWLALVYQAPALFAALWLVQSARAANSPAEYSPAKTLAQQLARVASCRRSYVTAARYLASSGLIAAVFLAQLPLRTQYYSLAKEYRHRPAANDAWLYFWFHAAFAAVAYAAHSLVFQRNRLRFRYGVPAVRPESVLFAGLARVAAHALFFTAVCSLSAPVAYAVARPLIYRAGYLALALLSLDTAPPPLRIAPATLASAAVSSLATFAAWEALNHVYETYATAGCLHAKKPISTLAADPPETLLSGLRDVGAKSSLCRLAAFQELAYIATSPAPECVQFRSAIYNSPAKKGLVWGAILDECSLVIRNTSARVNHRSKADLDALKAAGSAPADDVNTSALQKEKFLFGNSVDTSANDTTTFAISATSSPMKQYESPGAANAPPAAWHKYARALAPAWAFLNRRLTPDGKKSFADSLRCVQTQAAAYYNHFLDTGAGVLFRTTLKRDTESRVLNPVNYGNAVIALAGLLSHAVEEDRSQTVTSTHISEVLNLLERPIRSCANYTDFVPASVHLTAAQRANEASTKNHLVALMHDLTMSEFFQLCVKYNYKLNDLSLTSRAFKLAKWVIDASIASQQKQSHTQAAKFL